jgi:hypothetical protein
LILQTTNTKRTKLSSFWSKKEEKTTFGFRVRAKQRFFESERCLDVTGKGMPWNARENNVFHSKREYTYWKRDQRQ